ncbi:MAG: serine--tRNA ligase, partial [Bacteroidaceae bacterium]|nr:serine--tRNA ligase [Bacteroidaceae bacterium]
MLTLKLITEQTERVIAGLEKKHFDGARQAIDEVIAVDKARRQAQTELDQNLSNAKKLAAEIGMLMKQGKREEAEAVKAKVATLKETSKELENKKESAEQELTHLLCQIPNIPYDEVPEGTCAECNWVVKSNLKECVLGKDTVGNWDANPVVETAKLPHWELAKKYNLIDFDLGVKISGAGFPVYRGKGARLQRALIDFFLDEAQKSGYEEIMPPTVVNAASGYGTG